MSTPCTLSASTSSWPPVRLRAESAGFMRRTSEFCSCDDWSAYCSGCCDSAHGGRDILRGSSSHGGADLTTAGTAYLEWYYNTNVWKNLHYRGVRTLKLPLDMWNYQEIIFEHNLHWVVETGTRHGGSALFFSDLLTSADRTGDVITIDVSHEELSADALKQPGIHFLLGDSGAEAVINEVLRILPLHRKESLLLILDADHSKAHVLKELTAWVPRLNAGDYLIVEDTVVNGHPVRPDFGPGPMEAIVEYVEANPGRLLADEKRENKFGCTFA